MARRVDFSDVVLDIVKIVLILIIGGIIIRALWPLLTS